MAGLLGGFRATDAGAVPRQDPYGERQPGLLGGFRYGGPVQQETGPPPEDWGITAPIREFGQGFAYSVGSGNASMMGATMEALGSQFDNPFAKWAQRQGKALQDWAAKEERTDPPITLEQAEGFIQNLAAMGGMVGSGVGSTVPTIAGGLAGAAAGSVAGPVGAAVGGAAGAFGSGYLLNTGETFTQFKDEGVDPDTAAKVAAGLGVVLGAVDAIGAGGIVRGAKAATDPVKKSAIRAAAQAYFKGAGSEGMTEAAQSAIREGMAAGLTGDPAAKERALNVLEEGFAGALTGGFMSGAGKAGSTALDKFRSRGQQAKVEEAKARQKATNEATQSDNGAASQIVDALSQEGAGVIAGAETDMQTLQLLRGHDLPAPGEQVVVQQIQADGTVKATPGQLLGVEAVDSGEGTIDFATVRDEDGFEQMFEYPLEGTEIVPRTAYDQALARQQQEAAAPTPTPEPTQTLPAPTQTEPVPTQTAPEPVQTTLPEPTPEPVPQPAPVEEVAPEPQQPEQPVSAPASSGPQSSSEGVVYGSDGTEYNFEYRLVDADSLQVSHDVDKSGTMVTGVNPNADPDLQNRNLESPEEQQKIRSMVASGVDYNRMGAAPTMGSGAPTVFPDGQVVAGNSRLTALKMAYRKGKGKRYRDALEADYPEASAMTNPVLVRVVTNELTQEQKRQMGATSNDPDAGALGTTAQAEQDAQSLTDDVLLRLRDAELDSAANRPFVDAYVAQVIPENQRAQIVNQAGQLSEEGYRRIEMGLIAAAYRSRDLIDKLTGRAQERKSVRTVLAAVAPRWAQARPTADVVGQDISQNIQDVMSLIHDRVSKGRQFSDSFRQRALFEGQGDLRTQGRRGAINRQVLSWFYKDDPIDNPKSRMASIPLMKERINKWIDLVEDYGRANDPNAPPSLIDIRQDDRAPIDILLSGELGGLKEGAHSPVPMSSFDLSAQATPDVGQAAVAQNRPASAAEAAGAQTRRTAAQVQATVSEVAARILPKGTEVAVADTDTATQQGSYDMRLGSIQIALKALDPKRVLRHEAIHALRSRFTPAEWSALSKAAEGWRKRFGIDRDYPDATDAMKTEEAVARAYEDWAANREAEKGVAGIFAKIRRLLNGVRAAITRDKSLTPERVFGLVESGAVAKREGGRHPLRNETKRAKKVSPKPKPKASPKKLAQKEPSDTGFYKLKDEAAETAFVEARKGTQKDGMVGRLRDVSGEIYRSFTSPHKHLAQTKENALLHGWLRKARGAPRTATYKTALHLRRLVKDLDARSLDMLVKAIYMDNLYVEVKEGRDIPVWSSKKAFLDDYKELKKELAKSDNATLRERIKMRHAFQRAQAKKAVAAGVLSQEALDRPYYITHLVMEYQAEVANMTPAARMKKPKWARREGTTLAINLNLFEAESSWLQRLYVGTEMATTLNKIDKSKYNVRSEVATARREHNAEAIGDTLTKEVVATQNATLIETFGNKTFDEMLAAYRELPKASKAAVDDALPVFTMLRKMRQAVGRSIGQIATRLKDTDPDLPEAQARRYQNAIRALVGDADKPTTEKAEREQQAAIQELIKFLGGGGIRDQELIVPARAILSVWGNRTQFYMHNVDGFISPYDYARTLRLLARSGVDKFADYEAWQPDEGNVVHMAKAIPERLAEKLGDPTFLKKTLGDLKIEMPVNAEALLAEIASSMKGRFGHRRPALPVRHSQGRGGDAEQHERRRGSRHRQAVGAGLHEGLEAVGPIQSVLRLPLQLAEHQRRHRPHLRRARQKGAESEADRRGHRRSVERRSEKRQAQPTVPGGRGPRSHRVRRLDAGAVRPRRADRRDGREQGGLVQAEAESRMAAARRIDRVPRETCCATRPSCTCGGRWTPTSRSWKRRGSRRRPSACSECSDSEPFCGGSSCGANSIGTRCQPSMPARLSATTGTCPHVGNILRKFAIPFWSWREVNLKFYKRFTQNSWHAYRMKTADPELASELARVGIRSGMRAGVGLAVRAIGMYSAITAFNHMLFGEEEEELSDTDRRRLHLILGRAPDGSIIMLPTPGALSDLGSWVGAEDAMAAIIASSRGPGQHVGHLLRRRQGLPQLAGTGDEPSNQERLRDMDGNQSLSRRDESATQPQPHEGSGEGHSRRQVHPARGVADGQGQADAGAGQDHGAAVRPSAASGGERVQHDARPRLRLQEPP